MAGNKTDFIEFLRNAMENGIMVHYSIEMTDGVSNILEFIIEEIDEDDEFITVYSNAGEHCIKVNGLNYDDGEKAYIGEYPYYNVEVWCG